MKKILSVLTLIGLFQIHNIQTWPWSKSKKTKTARLVIHNKTGEQVTIYLKHSKWYQLGKIAKAVAIEAFNNATKNYGGSSGYSSGNGLLVYLNEGELDEKTNKRKETIYKSNNTKGIVELYIKKGFIKNLTNSKNLNNFKKSAQFMNKFKIKGEKKLQNKIHIKKEKTTHIYIEKNKESEINKKGQYKIWVTKPIK